VAEGTVHAIVLALSGGEHRIVESFSPGTIARPCCFKFGSKLSSVAKLAPLECFAAANGLYDTFDSRPADALCKTRPTANRRASMDTLVALASLVVLLGALFISIILGNLLRAKGIDKVNNIPKQVDKWIANGRD